MTLKAKKQKAIKLRQMGFSYNVIKDKIGVSKSSLSLWLHDQPLSRERINALRGSSPQRIARFQETMKNKRDKRLDQVRDQIKQNIGALSHRDILLGGLFLYWGEGGKTQPYKITLTNTDPDMIKFYILWLKNLGVKKSDIKIKLHLYSDMDLEKENQYWSKLTNVAADGFKKPHIKKTSLSGVKQKGFRHGTCNVMVDGRDITEYVLEAVKLLPSLSVLGNKK